MANLGKQMIRAIALLALAIWPASMSLGMDVPDSVELNSMSKLFNGVVFDHAMHLDVTDDCAVCHHHTTGSPSPNEKCARCHHGTQEMDVVACRDCHAREPFSAENLAAKRADQYRYHIDQIGLKAAYHQGCLGCHEEMNGPTGCQDCHTRNKTGDEFYDAGEFAPKGGGTHSGHH